MTPEEQSALFYLMGMGAYGSPLMESPTSQLNLVQDIGSMVFDTVFMYNQGAITPEQLLQSIRNATSEPVGDANDYDWESMYNSYLASGDSDLIDAANQIVNGGMTAGGAARWLRTRYAEEGQLDRDLRPELSDNIDSIEKQLEVFETKFRNRQLVDEKVNAGEYFYDTTTGMLMKPVLGEAARENLRAMGWKGPFAEPEFWRTIPDSQTMLKAAELQQQFSPLLENYEMDPQGNLQERRVDVGTREEIAKTSGAMKKLLELKPETAGQVETKATGWKEIEDAYKKALLDFNSSENQRPMGFQELGTHDGLYFQLTKENGKEVVRGYDSSGNVKRFNDTPDGVAYYKDLFKDKKTSNTEWSRKLGVRGNTYIVYRNGKTYLEHRLSTGTVTSSTPLVSSTQPPETQAKQSNDYWAKQAAYYTAKGMGAEREKKKTKATSAVQQIQAKQQEAMSKGTVPALEWLKMIPQLAAQAAQPAPQQPRPTYVKPQPRTLSDAEIEIMANMIAGGQG